MKRFDVCPAKRFDVGGKERLVVILQHEALDDLNTTIAAPLFKRRELPPVHFLRPLVTVGRHSLVVGIDRMAALPKRQLGRPVANLEPLRYELLRATDFLFSGL